MDSFSSGQLPTRLARAAAAVAPALQQAADRTGVAFEALFNTARLESAFNPEARARTSSATGLFQFIDSTWLSTLAKHGPGHGILPASRSEALALRRDPAIASLMAAEHMADNAAALEARLGRAVSQTDLYLAHFLGAGGAAKFLDQLASAPQAAAAALLPGAARANRAIFYEGIAPRSLQQVYDLLSRRLSGTGVPQTAPQPALNVPPRFAQALEAAPQASPSLDAHHTAQVARLLLAELGV
jgi:hypothetical protein